jgi:hypothetical protein
VQLPIKMLRRLNQPVGKNRAPLVRFSRLARPFFGMRLANASACYVLSPGDRTLSDQAISFSNRRRVPTLTNWSATLAEYVCRRN